MGGGVDLNNAFKKQQTASEKALAQQQAELEEEKRKEQLKRIKSLRARAGGGLLDDTSSKSGSDLFKNLGG